MAVPHRAPFVAEQFVAAGKRRRAGGAGRLDRQDQGSRNRPAVVAVEALAQIARTSVTSGM